MRRTITQITLGPRMQDPEETDLSGQTLSGRWLVIRRLGRGGMSTVYEARHRNGARVAIKVLNAALASKPRARERFLREGRLANSVGHPNAVRVLDDHVTSEGMVFSVMELLEGQTLRQRCVASGGRLDVVEALTIAVRVLEVLEAAHERGIIHRDIKPENIFLTEAAEVKVLDFGVAAVRDEALQDADITQSGTALGTPAFMAPEQARGRQSEVDARTDVWAVGATLFVCLAGRHVHEEASTVNEALIFAATQRAPLVSKFRPELGTETARVVDRALALNQSDRWPSARAMRVAIEAVIAQAGATGEAQWNIDPEDTLRGAASERRRELRRSGLTARIAAVGAASVFLAVASGASHFWRHGTVRAREVGVAMAAAPEPRPSPVTPLPPGSTPAGSHPRPLERSALDGPAGAPRSSATPRSLVARGQRPPAASPANDTGDRPGRRGVVPGRPDGVMVDDADEVPEAILDKRK